MIGDFWWFLKNGVWLDNKDHFQNRLMNRINENCGLWSMSRIVICNVMSRWNDRKDVLRVL